jgi:hypothetical protein
MQNIILVEGKDDKAFVEKLMSGIEAKPITVEPLGGLSKEAMLKSLDAQRNAFLKKPYEKLGIIIDQDDFSIADRLALVNECLQAVFGIQLENVSSFVEVQIENMPLQIACYFINFEGKGELESLLTRIRTQTSSYADCLNQWQNCLITKVSQKEFDKLWVHYYLKYDTATHQERQQAGKYCTLEYSLLHKSHIWDLKSSVLDELKGFLHLFD